MCYSCRWICEGASVLVGPAGFGLKFGIYAVFLGPGGQTGDGGDLAPKSGVPPGDAVLELFEKTRIGFSLAWGADSKISKAQAVGISKKDLIVILKEWNTIGLFSNPECNNYPTVELKTVSVSEIGGWIKAYRQPSTIKPNLVDKPITVYFCSYKMTTTDPKDHLTGNVTVILDASDGGFICSGYPLSY